MNSKFDIPYLMPTAMLCIAQIAFSGSISTDLSRSCINGLACRRKATSTATTG